MLPEVLDRIFDRALADRRVGQHHLADHLVDHGVGLLIGDEGEELIALFRARLLGGAAMVVAISFRPLFFELDHLTGPVAHDAFGLMDAIGRPSVRAADQVLGLGDHQAEIGLGGAAEVAVGLVTEVGAALAAPVRAGR